MQSISTSLHMEVPFPYCVCAASLPSTDRAQRMRPLTLVDSAIMSGWPRYWVRSLTTSILLPADAPRCAPKTYRLAPAVDGLPQVRPTSPYREKTREGLRGLPWKIDRPLRPRLHRSCCMSIGCDGQKTRRCSSPSEPCIRTGPAPLSPDSVQKCNRLEVSIASACKLLSLVAPTGLLPNCHGIVDLTIGMCHNCYPVARKYQAFNSGDYCPGLASRFCSSFSWCFALPSLPLRLRAFILFVPACLSVQSFSLTRSSRSSAPAIGLRLSSNLPLKIPPLPRPSSSKIVILKLSPSPGKMLQTSTSSALVASIGFNLMSGKRRSTW
ncbi:hypothetical protein KC367_g38 [Hortaea werneckii]|nr:hypothetical protein KC367_g38 [Hortaea werneckii]